MTFEINSRLKESSDRNNGGDGNLKQIGERRKKGSDGIRKMRETGK